MSIRRRIFVQDLIALSISIVTVIATYCVADRIFERMAHIEDELAYIWQAQAIMGGDLVLPSPPNPKSFLVSFVIDHNGVRFAKYPPGWPVVLAIGMLSGLRDWVNPLLSGLSIWLLYSLAKRITSPKTGLLAGVLMLLSPMFLMLSGTFLSHIWSLVLTLGFALAWLDIFGDRGKRKPVPTWLPILVAGLSLGVLILTRPMTALGIGIPFIIHGLIMFARADKTTRVRVITVGFVACLIGSLLFVWQFAVTGDMLQNPYTLWWEYDKVGFGPGYGLWEGGYAPEMAWLNLRYSMAKSGGDLLGWWHLWWLFLPFGVWSLRRKIGGWLVAGIFPGLLLAYALYWIGSWLYGPRYYFEGLVTLTLLNAAGISWLAGDGMHIRKILVGVGLAALVGYNLFYYLPGRLGEMHGLYDINRAKLEPFQSAEVQKLAPALVIVHPMNGWSDYSNLLELQNAQLDTPFIFALSRSSSSISKYYESFPERKIYHYYPDEPNKLYQAPRNNR